MKLEIAGTAVVELPPCLVADNGHGIRKIQAAVGFAHRYFNAVVRVNAGHYVWVQAMGFGAE